MPCLNLKWKKTEESEARKKKLLEAIPDTIFETKGMVYRQ
jgi:phenylpyruvate tautomerase PptA (4-oxalocrotonate tautomerase family)